jgi:DNA invertase Pin-like site-specific DNA recombinase
MMNVAMYLRKSRVDIDLEEKEGVDTLSKHKKMLFDYAKKNNLNVIDIFQEVVSGDGLLHRKEMLELLKRVEERKYEGILCVDLERLGRGSKREQGIIEETLKEFNVLIITLRKTYDLANEFDEEYLEFETFMSRRELKLIKRRMQRGTLQSVKEGNYVNGNLPYGYHRVMENGKVTIKINEKEAEIIKLIFKMRLEGNGYTKISNHLKTFPDVKPIKEYYISYILKNKFYIGYIQYGKRRYHKTKEGKTKVTFNDTFIEVKGKHSPIIDEETFNQVNRLTQSKVKNNLELKNYFSPILRCGLCGCSMVTTSVKTSKQKIMYLRCNSKRLSEKCGASVIRFDRVERMILKEIEKIIGDEQFRVQEEYSTEAINTTITMLNRSVEECDKQRLKLFELVEKEVYDTHTFIERSEELKKRKTSLLNALKEQQKEKERIIKLNQQRNHLKPSLMNFMEIYHSLDTYGKNDLIKTVIEKIYFYSLKKKDEINLKINFRF